MNRYVQEQLVRMLCVVTVYRYFFNFADAFVSVIIKGSIIKDLVSDYSEYESSLNKMLKICIALLCPQSQQVLPFSRKWKSSFWQNWENLIVFTKEEIIKSNDSHPKWSVLSGEEERPLHITCDITQRRTNMPACALKSV